VPTLETPMSPGGSQASAGEGLSPCNIGIGIGNGTSTCASWIPPLLWCYTSTTTPRLQQWRDAQKPGPASSTTHKHKPNPPALIPRPRAETRSCSSYTTNNVAFKKVTQLPHRAAAALPC